MRTTILALLPLILAVCPAAQAREDERSATVDYRVQKGDNL